MWVMVPVKICKQSLKGRGPTHIFVEVWLGLLGLRVTESGPSKWRDGEHGQLRVSWEPLGGRQPGLGRLDS